MDKVYQVNTYVHDNIFSYIDKCRKAQKKIIQAMEVNVAIIAENIALFT